MENIFTKLNSIDVGEHIERKGKFNYLSWAWAWAEFCKVCPDATYVVMHTDDRVNYFTDGRTAWVETAVTVGEHRIPMQLPVMDFNHKSIPVEKITSFDVNTAIQRCLTKNLAMFGLGLYIYAGEDLPEEAQSGTVGFTKDSPKEEVEKTKETLKKMKKESHVCADCGRIITEYEGFTPEKIIAGTTKTYGRALCYQCASIAKNKQDKEKANAK